MDYPEVENQYVVLLAKVYLKDHKDKRIDHLYRYAFLESDNPFVSIPSMHYQKPFFFGGKAYLNVLLHTFSSFLHLRLESVIGDNHSQVET